MRRADARNAPRNDLAALGNETREQAHVLIVDVVDSLDAKPANLLAPEILFLLGGDGFVTAGGPLSRAAGSSFGFWHVDLLVTPPPCRSSSAAQPTAAREPAPARPRLSCEPDGRGPFCACRGVSASGRCAP